MGRQPTGGCLSFLRRGEKKGLQTNLQEEIVQEIEALLGRQAIADLDSKPWKWRRADSLCDWPRERWNNG